MVCDLLIIDISGLFDPLKTARLQDLLCKRCCYLVSCQSLQVSADLLGNCSGKYTGVGSRIRHQLLFIQFLYYPQRLIRTDLKHPGTVIL